MKLYTTTFIFIIFKLHTTIAQFPKHFDFQKVGEIIFDNEKYNVLKPTTHMVTDYFKAFMTKRTRRRPGERIFMDNNGFRHYWSGLQIHRVSSRKTDIIDTGVKKSNNKSLEDDTLKIYDIASKTTIKNKPRRKKKTIKPNITKEPLREGNSERTIAKTSFFCPFFGVITMSAYID